MSTRGAKPPTPQGAPVETAAGLNGGPVPSGRHVRASQSGLVDRSAPQDVLDPRAKATRHGKVTADHANQGPSPRHR